MRETQKGKDDREEVEWWRSGGLLHMEHGREEAVLREVRFRAVG